MTLIAAASMVLVVTVFVVVAIPLVYALKLRNLRAYGRQAELFHRRIEPLLMDDETPDELLSSLKFLIREVSDRYAVYRLASSYLNRAALNSEASERIKERATHLSEFLTRRPELKKPFEEAVAAAMLAVVYNGRGIVGLWARVRMVPLIPNFDLETTAAEITDPSAKDRVSLSDLLYATHAKAA